MKKKLIILPLLVMLLASSCEFIANMFVLGDYTNYYSYIFKLDNKTNNDLICSLELSPLENDYYKDASIFFNEKSLICLGVSIDTVVILSDINESDTIPLAPNTFPLWSMHGCQIELYNLTDTTSYIFNVEEYYALVQNNDKDDDLFLFRDKIDDSATSIDSLSTHHYAINMVLTVDEELLNIHSKDYTILDKFPDYYK